MIIDVIVYCDLKNSYRGWLEFRVVTELHYISPVMKYFVFCGGFRRSMCRYISILTREFGFISGDSASSVVKLTNAVKKAL